MNHILYTAAVNSTEISEGLGHVTPEVTSAAMLHAAYLYFLRGRSSNIGFAVKSWHGSYSGKRLRSRQLKRLMRRTSQGPTRHFLAVIQLNTESLRDEINVDIPGSFV